MDRLRFAYARGARIEFTTHDSWVPYHGDMQETARVHLRINPQDTNHEYGHLSTALKKAALGWPQSSPDVYLELAIHLLNEETLNDLDEVDGEEWFQNSDHWLFLLLFFAEALADEGL